MTRLNVLGFCLRNEFGLAVKKRLNIYKLKGQVQVRILYVGADDCRRTNN